jgi:hypothetical protein
MGTWNSAHWKLAILDHGSESAMLMVKREALQTRQAARLAEGENIVSSPIPLLQTSQPTPGSLGEPLVAFLHVIPLTVETLAQEPLGIILKLGM